MGSEMCIRDRAYIDAQLASQTFAEALTALTGVQIALGAFGQLGAVSSVVTRAGLQLFFAAALAPLSQPLYYTAGTRVGSLLTKVGPVIGYAASGAAAGVISTVGSVLNVVGGLLSIGILALQSTQYANLADDLADAADVIVAQLVPLNAELDQLNEQRDPLAQLLDALQTDPTPTQGPCPT